MMTRIGRAIPGERRCPPRALSRPSVGAFSALTARLSQLGHDRMALTAGRVWRSKNWLRGDVS
jgi:hypothetical protein